MMRVMRSVFVLALLLAACAAAPALPAPTEDTRVAALQAKADDLTQQVQTLTAQRDVALSTQLGAAQRDISLADTWYTTWTTPQTILAGQYRSIGLQDEFTIRITFKATAPVRARVMDFNQYAEFVNGGAATADAVCPATASLDVTFHGAEGSREWA
jgi:outer membrane murein-binding lipoprotein Lpp